MKQAESLVSCEMKVERWKMKDENSEVSEKKIRVIIATRDQTRPEGSEFRGQ